MMPHDDQTIRVLSLDVIHRMAAGEVIDSAAAVVRELVENAIDAQATRIIVYLWLDQWKIYVSDNGFGIRYDNLKTIALPHTTSKISQQSDLSNITTLGFRGEALHSIAQFSQLEILSCPGANLSSDITSPITNDRSNDGTDDSVHPDRSGWLAHYNQDGEMIHLEEAAIAPGTIIRVNYLFQNWETRRLGNHKQQLKSIQTCIQNIALAHPKITIQVLQEDRDWISLGNTNHLTQRLLQLLPNGSLSDFSVIQNEQIDLVLGLPDRISRRSPDWIRISVNGRMVQVPELFQIILSVLRKTLPRDRYPIVFVHLRVPPHQVDWNRDPAKTSLYLQALEDWQTLIQHTLQQALSLSHDLQAGQRTTQFMRAAEQQAGYGLDRSITPIPSDSTAPTAPTAPTASTLRSLPGSLKAIAQVRNTYILAEHSAGLYLIEQHIAHERVLYEQICDRWQMVSIEPAIILSGLSLVQLDQLQSIGLTVDPFGEQLWAVRTLPALLLHRDDRTEALIELSLAGDLQAAQVSIACRTAIRNGTPLSIVEQQTLLQQWQQTRNPHTCPHGRPIYLVLQETALAQFFRRAWVIGKSHGLAKE